MSFYKIIGFAVTGLILILILRRMKEEYASFLSLVVCMGLTVCAVGILSPVVAYLRTLGDATDAGTLFTLMFKSCGIAVITSVAADICRDSGESALSGKVELCGKCTILALCLPLLRSVLEEISAVLG